MTRLWPLSPCNLGLSGAGNGRHLLKRCPLWKSISARQALISISRQSLPGAIWDNSCTNISMLGQQQRAFQGSASTCEVQAGLEAGTCAASNADSLSGEFPPSKHMVARSMGTLRRRRNQVSQHSRAAMLSHALPWEQGWVYRWPAHHTYRSAPRCITQVGRQAEVMHWAHSGGRAW
jgi:hypothetical protein